MFFLDQLINGLSLGALYALIAVGYTVVYGIVQLINFAHGEIFMIGGFASVGTWLLIGKAGNNLSWWMMPMASDCACAGLSISTGLPSSSTSPLSLR